MQLCVHVASYWCNGQWTGQAAAAGQLHASLGRSSGLLTADSVTRMEQFKVYLELYIYKLLLGCNRAAHCVLTTTKKAPPSAFRNVLHVI